MAINANVRNIFDNIHCFFSKKYRLAKAEKERKMRYEASIEATRQENLVKIRKIMAECPADANLLWIKFDCGSTGTEETRQKIISEQIACISRENAPWAYTRGSGLMCINIAKIGKTPESIAKILWEPNRFLRGAKVTQDYWFGKV